MRLLEDFLEACDPSLDETMCLDEAWVEVEGAYGTNFFYNNEWFDNDDIENIIIFHEDDDTFSVAVDGYVDYHRFKNKTFTSFEEAKRYAEYLYKRYFLKESLNESSQNKRDEFFRCCLSNDMDYEEICDILVDNLDDKILSSIMKDIEEYYDFTIDESLNEAKYWNDKQNNEFYNDIRYKVDEAVYQIMKDIFKDLRIDKLASQVHNLVPEYDPSWATHKRDADNNLRLHKVITGLSASLLDELYDKMNPGSLDRTVNNLRKY